jgi:hypothetical protein
LTLSTCSTATLYSPMSNYSSLPSARPRSDVGLRRDAQGAGGGFECAQKSVQATEGLREEHCRCDTRDVSPVDFQRLRFGGAHGIRSVCKGPDSGYPESPPGMQVGSTRSIRQLVDKLEKKALTLLRSSSWVWHSRFRQGRLLATCSPVNPQGIGTAAVARVSTLELTG